MVWVGRSRCPRNCTAGSIVEFRRSGFLTRPSPAGRLVSPRRMPYFWIPAFAGMARVACHCESAAGERSNPRAGGTTALDEAAGQVGDLTPTKTFPSPLTGEG
jgi:hypothetical protein